jgi:hypothetical protein
VVEEAAKIVAGVFVFEESERADDPFPEPDGGGFPGAVMLGIAEAEDIVPAGSANEPANPYPSTPKDIAPERAAEAVSPLEKAAAPATNTRSAVWDGFISPVRTRRKTLTLPCGA